MTTIDSTKKLLGERDEIDARIADAESILQANGVDMQSSLVDVEGFPRNDIDIYAVRNARHTIACLQNDRKALTDRIEEAMHDLHGKQCDGGDGQASRNEDAIPVVHRTSNKPFVRVDTVAAQSPAATAGLQPRDEVVQFGTLHAGNFHEMKQIAELVNNSVSQTIRITVIRENRPVRLELVPQRWSGQGLLGCSIVPIASSSLM